MIDDEEFLVNLAKNAAAEKANFRRKKRDISVKSGEFHNYRKIDGFGRIKLSRSPGANENTNVNST